MQTPSNAAAQMIVQAQSIVRDLTTQAAEIQAAITRQQVLIESLTQVAEWEPAESTSENPGGA